MYRDGSSGSVEKSVFMGKYSDYSSYLSQIEGWVKFFLYFCVYFPGVDTVSTSILAISKKGWIYLISIYAYMYVLLNCSD